MFIVARHLSYHWVVLYKPEGTHGRLFQSTTFKAAICRNQTNLQSHNGCTPHVCESSMCLHELECHFGSFLDFNITWCVFILVCSRVIAPNFVVQKKPQHGHTPLRLLHVNSPSVASKGKQCTWYD